ncbi:MAG: hypothetical protein ACRD2M_03855 [Terriglobales bacterium]
MQNNRLEASRLVNQAIEMQLRDNGSLRDAEACILRALELDPNSIEALQEAAHYYYRVDEQLEKAKRFASRCKEASLHIIKEMDDILNDPPKPHPGTSPTMR